MQSTQQNPDDNRKNMIMRYFVYTVWALQIFFVAWPLAFVVAWCFVLIQPLAPWNQQASNLCNVMRNLITLPFDWSLQMKEEKWPFDAVRTLSKTIKFRAD
ncbi:hypothetical protein Ciccas_002352 [Cichlidogyrus casuarinus]|uniref:Uncharacterized protein n=1 Tax=Cichlidogyrus casuarinus TaxID=1844966 RepID=A0ABD2QHI4_9PLAT